MGLSTTPTSPRLLNQHLKTVEWLWCLDLHSPPFQKGSRAHPAPRQNTLLSPPPASFSHTSSCLFGTGQYKEHTSIAVPSPTNLDAPASSGATSQQRHKPGQTYEAHILTEWTACPILFLKVGMENKRHMSTQHVANGTE